MTDLLQILKDHIGLDFLIDLEESLSDQAEKAHQMVVKYSGLEGKRSRALTGQARFRMMEQSFEKVCSNYGGMPLEGSVIPGTHLKVFQPFQRFQINGNGVILGFASTQEPGDLPVKNKSRLAGVRLNLPYQNNLFESWMLPKLGDLFVLLMFSKDRANQGKIQEFALGVIDSGYSHFELRIKTTEYMKELASPDLTDAKSDEPVLEPRLKLKSVAKFVPPEGDLDDDEISHEKFD